MFNMFLLFRNIIFNCQTLFNKCLDGSILVNKMKIWVCFCKITGNEC